MSEEGKCFMDKTMKRRIVTIIAVIVLIASLLATAIQAIYTNLSGKKGIVVVGGEEICNYASDKLNNYAYGSDLASAPDNQMYVRFEGENRTLSFTVSNISGRGNGIANRYDIGYNIIMRVHNLGGDDITSTAQVTVSKDSAPLSFDGSGVSNEVFYLGGGAIATHTYTVQFPEGCEDNMVVSVEARPLAENKSATMNTTLFRRFVPTVTASAEYNFSCIGRFSDEDGNTSPDLFHAFNYLVTVSNGSGTVTLTWNANYLGLDGATYAKIGRTAGDIVTSGNLCSIEFHVDASSIEQNFDIIFYKLGEYPSSPLTWDDLECSGASDLAWFVKTVGEEALEP